MFQSEHHQESTLFSTYGPRAGLTVLTWSLLEGLLLEKAAGSLMTLAETEGLLAADFQAVVDISTSPSAPECRGDCLVMLLALLSTANAVTRPAAVI